MQYFTLPDGKLQYSYANTTTQFFDPDKPLLAWQTKPYHYGLGIKAPIVRITNTTVNQSMRTEYFAHTYNNLNQITKTRLTGYTVATETFYKYKPNPLAT